MAVYFFDSSALVKRYIQETGSAWVQALCQQTPPEDLYIARIAGAEVISAILAGVFALEEQSARNGGEKERSNESF